jgi:hypothetical protein
VASRKRNRFVISIDSIENNGNECRFKHAAFDGIYYKNEDELNPALGNKSNKLRLGIKEILILD